MNTTDSKFPNNQLDLDALFADARSSQPNLSDDNFTKVVLNSLPREPLAQKSVNLRKSFSFDLIGAMIGLLCVYLFVDGGAILSSILNLVPESFVVSPIHVAGLAAAFMVTSIAAWWTMENVRL